LVDKTYLTKSKGFILSQNKANLSWKVYKDTIINKINICMSN